MSTMANNLLSSGDVGATFDTDDKVSNGDRDFSDVTKNVKGKTMKQQESTKTTKSAGAFRTISEVATELGVQQHVLRFWETKFTQVRPLKRGGGRRYYRPEDVAILRKIYDMLYNQGYTIKGAQKLIRGHGKQQLASSVMAENGVDASKTANSVEAVETVEAKSAPEKEVASKRDLFAVATTSNLNDKPVSSDENVAAKPVVAAAPIVQQVQPQPQQIKVVEREGLSDSDKDSLKVFLSELYQIRELLEERRAR